MPNWCDNTLTVTGPKNELKTFKDLAIKDGVFKMGNVFPTPEELNDTVSPNYYKGNDEEGRKKHEEHVNYLTEKYGHSDWYLWRLENWNTKWDASEDSQSIFQYDANEDVVINFATAWSPPVAWMRYAANMFPSLKFRMSYMEEGMGFCGCTTIENGIMLEEDGDIRYEDYNGTEVKWDGKNWVLADYREVIINNKEFYPTAINPFE